MTTRAKRAAIYTRTSQDKDDAYIIASQIEETRAYALRNNFVVTHEFREEYTGTKLDRPQLNKLRQLIAQRAIDAIIIYRADRLARMQHIAGYILHEEIFPNNVELHIVTFGGQIRPGTRDVLVFNIESAIGQDERDSIVERTRRGKRAKLLGADGHRPAWIGYGPYSKYGYEKRGKARTTHHVIIEEEAAVIRRIFDLFVNKRMKVFSILRLLDSEGVPPPSIARNFTRKRAPHWHQSAIYTILRDSSYTGVWWADKHSWKDNNRLRPREEWIRLDFPELRIIDDDTFKRARELLAEGKARRSRNPLHHYLLTGHTKCYCGRRVSARTDTPKTGRKVGYYYCPSRSQYKMERCELPYVQVKPVDDAVWECIEALLRDPRAQLEGLKRVQERQRAEQSEALTHMDNARRTLAECERLLEVYSDQEAEGIITRAMLRKKKAELDERAARAQAVYDEYAALIETAVLSDNEIADLTNLFQMLNSQLADERPLDFEVKRQVVDGLDLSGVWKIEEAEEGQEVVLYLSVFGDALARLVAKRIAASRSDTDEDSDSSRSSR